MKQPFCVIELDPSESQYAVEQITFWFGYPRTRAQLSAFSFNLVALIHDVLSIQCILAEKRAILSDFGKPLEHTLGPSISYRVLESPILRAGAVANPSTPFLAQYFGAIRPQDPTQRLNRKAVPLPRNQPT
jgi:hypothetical protein